MNEPEQMMQSSARPPAGTPADLARLSRAQVAAFLVDAASGMVLEATAAAAALGVHAGAPATESVRRAARDLARLPGGFARLRLSGGLVPRLLRYTPAAMPGGPAVLFGDPTAGDPAPAPPAPEPAVDFPSAGVVDAPVRILFETDAEGRISHLSPAFAEALGSRAAVILGRSFAMLEAEGLIRSDGAAAPTLAAAASFSDLRVRVPARGPDEAELLLSLGGVPLLDAARRLKAVRGFGVLRAVAPRPAHRAEPAPPAGFGRNVVPLRGGSLSPQERSAFREIARTLAVAIEDWPKPRPEAPAPLLDADDDGLAEEAPGRAAELLDRLPVGLLVQQDGDVTYANRTFLAWSGWTDLAELAAAGGLERVLGRSATGGLHLLTADGGSLPVEVRLVAAPFLGRPALLNVIRKLDAAEEREERAIARRAALDMVPWPVFLLEREGIIRLANRAAATRLGFTAAELAGEPFTVAVAPQDRAAAIAALDRAVAGTVSDLTLRLRDRAGETFPVRAGLTRAGADDQLLCVAAAPEAEERETASLAAAMEGRPAPAVVVEPATPFRAAAALPREAPAASPAAEPTLSRPAADSASDAVPAPTAEAATGSTAAEAPAPATADAALAQAGSPHPAAAGQTPPPDSPRLAPTTPAEAPPPAPDPLPRLARRMLDGLGTPIATALDLSGPDTAGDAAPSIPAALREALTNLSAGLSDLVALAQAETAPAPVACDVAALVRACVAEIAPAARRRAVALRCDLPEALLIHTDAPRLARLIRLMLEEAVSATPAGGAVAVSLTRTGDAEAGEACLQVADGGPALDEVARAAALDPLTLAPGTDRFAVAGHPLRAARLKAEATALGGSFDLRADLARGMVARLAVPA